MGIPVRRQMRSSSQRGSVIVEFALLSPIMVALFLGVVMFGYDFYTYNRLEEVVRAGSRFASIQTYDVLHGADPALTCASCSVVLDPSSSAFAELAANFTVYGTPTVSGPALVEGLSTARVRVTMDVRNGAPASVWIAVTGYPLLTPGGTVSLTGKPAAVFPYLGNYMVASP